MRLQRCAIQLFLDQWAVPIPCDTDTDTDTDTRYGLHSGPREEVTADQSQTGGVQQKLQAALAEQNQKQAVSFVRCC